jgi:hypothetical protein
MSINFFLALAVHGFFFSGGPFFHLAAHWGFFFLLSVFCCPFFACLLAGKNAYYTKQGK